MIPPPIELERLLARGRGAGWLAARERGTSAIELVLGCVLEDPRWDSQFEARDEYYASLLLALAADPQAIVDALVGRDPEDAWLARCVLIQLAWRGHAGALAAVVERVRAGRETDDELGLVAGMAFAERVYALAGRTIVASEAPPARAQQHLDPDLGVTDDLGVTKLIAIATEPGDARQWLAARRLGELGHAELIDAAEAYLRSECGVPPGQRSHRLAHRRRVAWLRYLEALPAALTLPRAREWFHAEWPLSLAADEILARHAEPVDRPMLEQVGAEALAARSMYRLCSIVDALARLAAPESIDLLIDVYCTVDYSYARGRACVALLAHAARPEVQALLVEALWDCEAGTREDACEGVDPRAAAARLRELADDPFERPPVREAAREALADDV